MFGKYTVNTIPEDPLPA